MFAHFHWHIQMINICCPTFFMQRAANIVAEVVRRPFGDQVLSHSISSINRLSQCDTTLRRVPLWKVERMSLSICLCMPEIALSHRSEAPSISATEPRSRCNPRSPIAWASVSIAWRRALCPNALCINHRLLKRPSQNHPLWTPCALSCRFVLHQQWSAGSGTLFS